MTWDDFEDADIWSGFQDVGTEVQTGIQDLGLGSLDEVLGGDLSSGTLENYINPPSEAPQESYRERAMRNAERRRAYLEENPMEFEPLDTQTQALLGLQQGLYDRGREIAGLGDIIRIPGARQAAQYFGEQASELEDLTTGPGTSAGNAFQVINRTATSLLPGLLAGPAAAKLFGRGAAFPAWIATAMGQSGGSVFEDAQDAYIARGMDPEEARGRSYGPAMAAALITGAATTLFGRTGAEALSRGLTKDAITKVLQAPLQTIIKGSAKEGLEEWLDQVGQGIVARASYDPEKPVENIILESLQALGLGFLLGGFGEVTQASLSGLAKAADRLNAPMDESLGGSEWDQFEDVGPAVGQEIPAPGQAVPTPAQEPIVEPEPVPDVPRETPGQDVPTFDEPAPLAEPVQEPEPQAPAGRRKARGVQGLGESILTAMGADEETAAEFVSEYLKANPGASVGEKFRNDLITAYRASGIVGENVDKGYSENAEDYIRFGADEATAREYVSRAKEANLQRKSSLRSRNRERMAGIRRGVRAYIPEATRVELQEQEPTPAQKESGNYKKGHIKLGGLDVSIENVEGSTRSGVDKDGETWEVTMPADYGYVKGTTGKDGDNVDIYVGPNRTDPNAPVFVVDQINDQTGAFDEHKALFGFPDQQSAIETYDAAFSDGKGPVRRGAVTRMTQAQFKEWVESGKTKKPLAYSAKLLRESEARNLPPEGRPIDRRERVKWLDERSRARARTAEHDMGWNDLQESAELAGQIIDDDVASVPDQADGVRLEGKDGRYVLITRSVKPGNEGKWQTTAFDERGPWMDTNFPTLKQAVGAWMGKYGKGTYGAPYASQEDYRIAEVRVKPKGGEPKNAKEERAQKGLQVQPVQDVSPAAGAEVAPATAPSKPRQAPRQWGDLIETAIGMNLKIRGKKTMKPGTEGYYSEAYKEAITLNALKPLFTNDGRGQTPDEAKQTLIGHGLNEDATVEDMWEKFIADAKGRQAVRRGETKEDKLLDEMARQATEFGDVALENKRKTKKAQKKAQPKLAADLIVGDKFELEGEEVVVTDIAMNPETEEIESIMLEDGRRFGVQKVNGQDVIYTDDGVDEAEVEWLPEPPVTGNEPAAEPAPAPLPTIMDAEGQQVLEAGEGGQLAEIPGQELDARQAQMRAEQSTPLGAAPIQTQENLFGEPSPENADIPLFDPNANKRQEAIGDRGTFTIDGRGFMNNYAQGTAGLIEMIDDSDLTANTKAVWKAFLETPVMKNLNWEGFRIELWDYLQRGAYGSRLGRLIQLSEAANPATFPHEIAHILFDTLPKSDQEQIEKWRMAELKKRFGDQVPEQFKSGNMTSAEFHRLVKSGELAQFFFSDETVTAEGVRDLYKLTTPSEFYAHLIGDKFAKEAFGGRNNAPSVWKKLRDIFLGAMDALRRLFKFSPSQEQIYRETLKGTWKPDLDAIVANEEAQASYSRNAEAARNAASLAQTRKEQEIEATHQLAQSVDLTDLLIKHGAHLATAAAQKATAYLNLAGIKAVGVSLNNRVTENYQQLKARITDQYQRNWIARIAAVQVANFEGNAKKVIEQGNKAFKRLTSPTFLKKVQRRAKLGQMANNAKLLDETATAMLEAAYKNAQRVLKEEAKSDLEIAEAEGAVRAIEEAMGSSSAMSKLINDMVDVLSASPAGTAALSNPDITQKEILDIYRDIKRSTDTPISNPNLLNWASYILARNAELRDALWAARLARDSKVRKGMGPYETKFMADLEADPLKTLRREMREAKRRVTEAERARFAYLTINKEVLSELAELQSQLEAKEIVENVLSDPAFKGLRKTVYADATVEGTQRPFVAFADKLLLLPSGRQLNVDPEYLKGSQAFFNQVRAQYLAAVEELNAWLLDPANQEDTNYLVHKRNLTELQDYFTTLDVLRPADTMRLFNTALTIPRDVIEAVGGRMRAAGLKALNRWNTVKRKGGEWNQEWSTRLWENRRAALKSHDLKWDEFSDNDLVRANRIWWETIGNILGYSHSRQQGGFKVGDIVLGREITQEDVDNLKLQSEMGTAGFDVIRDDQITEDFLGDIGLFRRAIKGTEKMVRRVFNEDALDFSRLYSNARKGFQDAFREGDEDAQAFYEAQMIQLLNQHWDKVAFPFIWDRSPEFSLTTIFDGPRGAFKVIADRMLQRGVYLRNFDELIDELYSMAPPPAFGEEPMTRDDVKKIIMVEWGRIINQWYQQAKDDTEGRMVLPVRGARAKNATTRSRNNALAPYSFYEYGFKDSRSVATFAGALHSRPMDRLVSVLIAMEEDLQRQINELHHARDPKAVISRKKIERKNGETYDNFVRLESRKKKVTSLLRELTTYDEDQDVDQIIGRTLGAQTGLLVSTIRATTRNFTTGGLYAGTVANRLLGHSATVYPIAFWNSWVAGTKGWASVGLSGFKWAGKKLTYNLADIPRAIIQISKGQFRGAVDTTLNGLVDALGREAIERVKQNKKLIDEGILYIPDFERQRRNYVLGSFAYSGQIAERQLSLTEKVGSLPAMLMEFPQQTFLRSFMPLIGDTAVNAATAATFEGKVIPTLENQLRELFIRWRSTGYREFDFNNVQSEKNVFSPQEVSKGDEKAFNELRKFFEEAGLSFDETAVRFIGELRANPKAKWLTDEERKLVVNLAIDQVNRSSSAGSPIYFRGKGFWINFFKPFMSWKTRTLQMFNRLMSVPAQSEKSRKAQWAALATLTILPVLLLNALMQVPAEEADRLLARIVHDQEKSSRHPWEREGLKSRVIGWTINATLGIPGLDIAMNMLNDLPVRASLNPDVAMIEKIKDLARYAAGAIQTGDPTFKLAETIAGIFPDAKIVLNRLESESGKRESSNVIAVMRRHGNTELLRATGEPPAGVNYGKLSPYGPAMENAVMNGDFQEFNKLYREAVQVARGMNRAEPEQAAKQMFSHRNPWDRAFKQKLTDAQRREFMNRLSGRERAMVLDMERKFARAAGMIDASFNVVRDQNQGGGVALPPTAGRGGSTPASERGSLRARTRDSGLRRRESGLRSR